jgi:transcriptional regulator with XRE-family HTH domain
MDTTSTLGQKLSSLRGHYRKTQKQVAFETGIKQEMISNFETDTKIPSIINLQKLAKVYHTTVEGIQNYEPSNSYFNTFNDQAKGFFNVGKVIVSNIEEIIQKTLMESPLEKGKEMKVTISFKIE